MKIEYKRNSKTHKVECIVKDGNPLESKPIEKLDDNGYFILKRLIECGVVAHIKE